ncbi:MAG: pyruvate, phosphate dikinase [Candidatus Methanoperedens sp.]|nr:pyruvate, phosphate dikinase [Candidatus Methanoperedens sp.]
MNKITEKYFLNWEEAFSSAIQDAGGKGKNLGSLHRYGFPVPAGGVLTSRAYWDFFQHNDLMETIHAASSINAEDVLEPANEKMLIDIRQKITEGEVPDIILQELSEKLTNMELLNKSVAVRSSATAEDSAAASFAGVHESFLNILGLPDIIKAIKNCYTSLWTPRAVAYRRKMGFSDDKVGAAVVIMELVPAVAAGVAFSCDPRTGRRDVMIISANFGLGESVVSGAIEPDEYILATEIVLPEIIEKKTGSKKRYTRLRHEGATELLDAGEDVNKKQVLNDARIIELGSLTLRVHEALGGGIICQDIEWAFDGKQFYVLQARPVTKLPEPNFPGLAGQPVIWSNSNIKDAAPFVWTTLNWNIGHRNLNLMLKSQLLAAGYHPPPRINWVRLYKGRGYFNLSALQWGFYDAVGYLPGDTNKLLGGHQPEIKVPAGNPMGGWKGIIRVLRRLNLVFNILKTQISAKKIFKDMWQKAQSWDRLDFHDMTDQELITLITEIGQKYIEFAPAYMMFSSSASLPLDMLARTLEKDFPGRGYSLTNNLLAGSAEITSAEHGYRLIELANTVQKDEAAYRYFTSEHFDPAAFKNEIPVDSQFRKEFDEFLNDFGHRAVYEAEIANPRWSENPGYLLENIRAAVLSPDKKDNRKAQAEKRKVAQEEIARKLKWSFQHIKVSMWVRQARKGSEMREMAKSVFMKPLEPVRLLYQDIGRRLAERGILNEQADVYHCTITELVAILCGYWDGSGLKVLVTERKKLREELSQLDPPDVIIDEVPQPKTEAPHSYGKVMTGIGVAAGKASGQARLISHPGENTRLQAGDVLVAPSTDPGWTPLFLRANALVMEVGGFLSHGAIVAREYGVPAVVNVPGVMKTLKDGEQLTVDGDEGKVYRG